jgi:hypothetical protein
MEKKKIFSIFLLLSFFYCFSQSENNSIPNDLPRFAIRGNVAIPKVVSSKTFQHSFSGVMAADLGMTVKLFSEFFVGVGYSYTYYKPQKAFRDQYINTNMQSHNGFIKLGIDHFFKSNGFATFSLNAGVNYNQYQGIRYKHDSLIGKNPTNFYSGFIEPVIGLYFIVDPNFAIGGHLSYNYNFSQFNPAFPGFDKWYDYSKVSNKWNMSMITLGFGFYYGLVRK